MLFGLDGIEIGLIISFSCLLAGILTGFPVAYALAGSALFSFAIIAILAQNGILMQEVIDPNSPQYSALLGQGVAKDMITKFSHPELPTLMKPLFERGLDDAINRTISFIVNRMNERVFAGPSIETLLAVAMFVLMGIALERSRIANDLLTTMARVFGPLPGGLAVSVVVVGAFLAASTGIVGATVVTMGLLSLPTMLRNKYSPELATGVIAASGTLGQIIPPSIVIVLLGSLAGDIYGAAQENRAKLAGCGDALTYLGHPAVLSVGTLFKAAILPGLFLALLYALYAFGVAMFKPSLAPPVHFEARVGKRNTKRSLFWFMGIPVFAIVMIFSAYSFNIAGSQTIVTGVNALDLNAPELRTNVSPTCEKAMIKLHGQEKWDRSVKRTEEIKAEKAAEAANPVVANAPATTAPASGNATGQSTDQNAAQAGGQTAAKTGIPASNIVDSKGRFDPNNAEVKAAVAKIAPLSGIVLIIAVLLGLVFTTAYGVKPDYSPIPLVVGGIGVVSLVLFDLFLVNPLMSPGEATLYYAIPSILIIYGLKQAIPRLMEVEVLRVVFPPLILVVAVLGSILGGITNPTPAAALGAVGAVMLAAQRKLTEENKSKGSIILLSTVAIVVFLLVGVNFDLRVGLGATTFAEWVAFFVTLIAYHVAFFGVIYACWVLWNHKILTPILRESAKVTAMVFSILIGSQMLNLVLISFGGEHYIQSFLHSFEKEWTVFLLVMVIMFILGFVLDFLEIIYIIVPIVGPVIYGGTLDAAWVTIMITVNLQTSFLTPPFGFALFYLRGVAPPEVTTAHIYRGVVPFILIQVLALGLLWLFPSIITIVPALLPSN